MTTGNARKLLVGCLKVAAGLALLFVLLVAGAVGWGIHANSVAEREAGAFCAATKPGQDLAGVLQRAHGEGGPKRSSDANGVYHFYWLGMIFNARECEVTTAAGRVVSARVVAHDD